MEQTITGQINEKIIELLDKTPEGIRWSDLLKLLKKEFPTFHPKTINGCVWKIMDKYPNLIYKPEKGLFRLVKYKS